MSGEKEIGRLVDLYEDSPIHGYTYSETHVIRDDRLPAAKDRIWAERKDAITHDDFQRRIKIERMRAVIIAFTEKSFDIENKP